MRLISWNCQGLGNPLTVQALKVLVTQEKPDIVFLMETKNQTQQILSIQRKLNFSAGFFQEPTGLAGGLALFWTNKVSLNITYQSFDMLDSICTDLDSGITMRLTYLLAPARYPLRQNLWTVLRRISNFNSLPWLCTGDYNEVLYPWEKVSKCPAESYRMVSFRDVINDCYLMDLGSKGCAFTWSNNRQGDAMVKAD